MRSSRAVSVSAAVVGVCAFLLNPALLSGCSRGFSYGEREVVALLAAPTAREQRFTADGVEYAVTLDLRQAASRARRVGALSRVEWVREADACTGRTFVRSAGACADTTTIPVEGVVTLRRLGASPTTLVDAARVEGELVAFGLDFGGASMSLHTAEGTLWLRTHDGARFELGGVELGSQGQRLRWHI